jgi:hypothetical protein
MLLRVMRQIKRIASWRIACSYKRRTPHVCRTSAPGTDVTIWEVAAVAVLAKIPLTPKSD